MKSFLISICFFCFFLIITTANCFYVTGVLKYISTELEKLPETKQGDVPATSSKKAEEILKHWNKHKKYLSLSINLAEIRDCTTILSNLAKLSKSDTFADYNAALWDARNRINTLLYRESFSPSNIV
ncbi:MAG: DUF4363 family protein [Clostridia bacterium]|nr:DUF4363 family protein [Clostridia bacterium]